MNSTTNGTAPALTPAKQLADLRTYLEASKGRLADVVPKHLTPERLVRIACAAMSRAPKLLSCSRESILLAIMEAGQLGLEAGSPLGHAYLVPFANRKTQKLEATLQIGYKGLIHLARLGGAMSSPEARVVYERDHFQCEFGLHPVLVHKPHWGADRGQPLVAYAIIRLVGQDSEPIVDVMSVSEINAVRARSTASDNGPWVTDWSEMAKKTVLRRALKYCPMSTQLSDAVARDEAHEEAVELPVIDVTTASPEPAELPANARTEEIKEKLRRKRAAAPELAAPAASSASGEKHVTLEMPDGQTVDPGTTTT